MASIFGRNRIKLIDDEDEERNKGLFPRLTSVLRSSNNRLPPTESNVSAEDEDGSMRSLDERFFSNIEDASGEADWLDCQSSAKLSHSFQSQNDFLYSKRFVHSTPSSIYDKESHLIVAENQQQKFQSDSSDKGLFGASNPCRGSILVEETNETVADDIEGSERFDNRTIVGWYYLAEEADDLISPGWSGRRPRLERPAQSPSPSQGFDLEDEDTVSSPTTTIPKHARSCRRSTALLENSDSSRSRRSLPTSLRRKSSLKKDEESHRRSLRSSRQSTSRPSSGDSPRRHSLRLSRKGMDKPNGDSRKEADRVAERRLTSNSIAETRQRIKNDDDTTTSRQFRTLGQNKNKDEASAANSYRSSRTKVPNAVQEREDAVQKDDDSGRVMERSCRGEGWTTPRKEKKNMNVIPAVVEKTKLCQVEFIDNVNAKLEEKEKPKFGSRTTGDHDRKDRRDSSKTNRKKKDCTSMVKCNWEENSWTSNSKNSFNDAEGADDENGFGSPIVHAKIKLGAIAPDLVNFFACHDEEKTRLPLSTKSVPCSMRLKESASPIHIRRTSSIRKSSRRARETSSAEPSELRFRSPNR